MGSEARKLAVRLTFIFVDRMSTTGEGASR